MNEDEAREIQELLSVLKEDLADRKAALPAHSIRSGQLIAIEELEDQIKDLETQIDKIEKSRE